jgi:hypothetical protein
MPRARHCFVLAGVPACSLLLAACGGGGGPGTRLLAPSAEVRAAQANPVTISPLAGTRDAMPATQISFLGGKGTRVADVRVSGSASGAHAGVLRVYSTGTGESFIPTRPFLPGEQVTVTASLASGGARGRRAHSTFAIARLAAVGRGGFPPDQGDAADVQRYASAPTLTPSTVTISTPAQPGASPGDLFLAPYQGPGTAGPMIVDQRGRLIWFHPLAAGLAATNFAAAGYRGARVLVWWQGRILELGYGAGVDEIYDSSYREIGRVAAGNGLYADLHVIRLTPQGTAWIDAYEPVRLDLSASGGKASSVLSDSVVQEIDIATGLVMWEWHALGHIPLAESKNPLPSGTYPWDYAHVNSVDPGNHGDVLMSFRNTWSVDDIDIHSGGFRWRLGGAGSSLHLGPGATFYWQHDAAFRHGGSEVSLFDNGSTPAEEAQSRGVLLAPDLHSRKVRLVRQFVNPSRTLLAESQGNMQALPHGNWLLGYGRLPDFTEFAPDGRVLLDGALGPGVQSFATTLSPWQGHPLQAPSIAARSEGGRVEVAASWNGATEVASWRLLAGMSANALAPAGTVSSSGFETTLATAGPARFVAVQALGTNGATLGVSATVAVG